MPLARHRLPEGPDLGRQKSDDVTICGCIYEPDRLLAEFDCVDFLAAPVASYQEGLSVTNHGLDGAEIARREDEAVAFQGAGDTVGCCAVLAHAGTFLRWRSR